MHAIAVLMNIYSFRNCTIHIDKAKTYLLLVYSLNNRVQCHEMSTNPFILIN